MSGSFLDAANLFVWSLWGELGVPSPERRQIDLAIDLEPLIGLTNLVSSGDPRLRSHAATWLDAFPELVSKARFKRLVDGDFGPAGRSAREGTMAGGPMIDIKSASAIQLRIRSALGVSARSEIIRQFVLDQPRSRRSASDLAQLSGYTKRNVEKALESLERGGWVDRIRGGTSLRWSVRNHAAVAGLFSPVPSSNASFMALAQIVESLISLDDVSRTRVQVRSAATRQLLSELGPTADWGEVQLPDVSSAENAWEEALLWVKVLPSTAL
jgi:DNA-binding transcriptional ArsR family regulator